MNAFHHQTKIRLDIDGHRILKLHSYFSVIFNYRYIGSQNYEFNLRHDWNTLLSDDDTLTMTQYSDDLYPHADQLVKVI